MMISTRGRYALRVMIDLAENRDRGYIPMKDIANRQGVSLKYLERIVPALAKNNYIEGVQGKGGGYRLTRSPEEYKVGEILRLTEGDLAPVSCLECDATPCERVDQCRTINMWSKLNTLINEFFDGVTIADLMVEEESI
ncbi:MAG: RrF2 family transcriptional regulator [Eubacterium sp.]|nr:RrF2 family transcriptional regulator [Eubacterium sp.]